MTARIVFLAPLAALALCASAALAADPPAKPDYGKITEEEGKYFTGDGDPIYNVDAEGKVDWYTYSGFRRYHSECHVCHGPEGEGSSYAPALKDSVRVLSYSDFMEVVTNGRTVNKAGTPSVMPAFGVNRNVMCYLDDIYVYLKARSDEVVPRGKIAKRADKPQAAKDHEKDCLE